MTMNMRTRTLNPLKGLLTYFWYYLGNKFKIIFLQVILMGIVFLIFENLWVVALFNFNAITMGTVTVLTTMGSKEVDWERFQLSMPVRRSDLAKSQYISVGVTPFLGLPLFIIFNWLASFLHEDMYFTILSAFTTAAPLVSSALIMCSLVFPLAMIPALENKIDALFWLIIIVSLLIPYSIVILANNLGWSTVATTSGMLIVSIVVFIVSYFVTRRLYAKSDF